MEDANAARCAHEYAISIRDRRLNVTDHELNEELNKLRQNF